MNKKLKSSLVSIAIGLMLSSCSDDKEYCFACDTQVVTVPKQGSLTATNKKAKYCGKTEQEAKDFEK